MQREANPWSRQTAPFRQMMQRFTRSACGLLADIDALDAWCTQLVEPTLPSMATLDSPFAGLQPPELSAPANAGLPPSRRAGAVASTASGQQPLATDGGSVAHPAAGAKPPAASSAPLANGTGASVVYPVRGGKPARPAEARRHSQATPRPAEPSPTPDSGAPHAPTAGATARLAQASKDAPRRPAASDAPRPTAEREPSQAVPAQAAAPAQAPAADVPSAPGATVASGLHLLAALTASLYARQPVATAGAMESTVSTMPRRSPLGALPWRAPDHHLPPLSPATPRPMPDVSNGEIAVPAADSALGAPTPSAAYPVVRRALGLSAAPPASVPLDPDELADLINEVLVEQARRHGANLP